MSPLVYGIPIFLTTIVIEAQIARKRRRPIYDLPDAVTSLHLGMLSQVSGAFAKALSLGMYVLVFARYRALELPANSPWVFVFALLAYDLCYYFYHRCGHTVGFMWAGHSVHHSSEYYNLSTALRQPSTTLLYAWPFYLPLALIGVPPKVFVVVGLIDLVYQYWVHTELIGSLGILDRILITPSNHRVHHGQNDYCLDRNYGAIFIIWDRIFGTYANERADEPVVFGMREPLRSLNPLWSNLHGYAELLQKSRVPQGLREKLASWFAAPNGQLTAGKQPRFEPATFVRYDPAPPTSVQRYALVQYVLVVLAFSHFIAISESLPLGLRGVYGLGILVSMIGVGALLEGSRLARRLEPLRVAAFAMLFASSPRWFGSSVPLVPRLAALVIALLCVLWLRFESARIDP